MAAGKAPGSPFQKLAAAFGASARTEARDGGTTDVFLLERELAQIHVELAHGAAPCLLLRAHEEEAAPSSDYRKNVLTRMRARLVYPALSIRRATSLDRVNSMFAVRFDVRTGDPAFDRAVTVAADLSDEILAQTFAVAEARAAVLEVLGAGFTLRFDERALHAELLSPSESHLTAIFIEPVARALTLLVEHVPRLDPAGFSKRPQAGRVLTGVILATGLVAAGALAPGTLDDPGIPVRPLPHPIVPLPMMIPGVAVGSGAFVLAFLLLRWQLKRKNVSTDLPLILALFVVMATLGVGALDAANRLLDDAPLATHDVKVTARDTGTSRKSGAVNDWTLVVPSWRAGVAQLELVVDSELHHTLRPGDPVRVTVHPGFFGWEWGAVVERGPGARAEPENDKPGDFPRRSPPQ